MLGGRRQVHRRGGPALDKSQEKLITDYPQLEESYFNYYYGGPSGRRRFRRAGRLPSWTIVAPIECERRNAARHRSRAEKHIRVA